MSQTDTQLVEFWAVPTRPLAAIGLGLNAEQTVFENEYLKYFFRLLPEVPIHDEWQRIVVKHRISGKSAHDIRLVAAMIVHGIGEILTFNMQDFARQSEISVLDPANVN